MFKFKRFKKRLRLEFTDGQNSGRGFMTELAEDSLLLTCRKPLNRGTWIEITAELPDGSVGRVKAKVQVAKKQISGVGEGSMEVELTLYNKAFSRYLRSVVGELQGNDLSLLVKPGDFPGDPEENEERPQERPAIILPEAKPAPEPVQEQVAEPTTSEPPKEEPEKPGEFIILECGFCGTKNKVPEDRLFEGPICAMCKEKLLSTS